MPAHPVVLFVAAVVLGTALLRAATRRAAPSDRAEILLGLLLCSGLLLLGAGLKVFR